MLHDLLACRNACRQWRLDHPQSGSERGWFKDFLPLLLAKWRGQSPLDREEPWITFQAIAYLDKYIQPHMHVLEFGSGGSTLFFARRCRHVVTIEHDKAWHEQVRETLKRKKIENVTLKHVSPVATADAAESDPYTGYGSTDEQFVGMSFKDYVHAARMPEYPRYDVISVDGRARPACIRLAMELVAPDGLIIVDNAERDYYNRENDQLKANGWHCAMVAGPALGYWHWTMTRFWHAVQEHAAEV